MQEIDRFWKRTGIVDQSSEIAQRLPDYYWAYGPGVDVDASYRDAAGRLVNRRRQFGNMVLAKWPLTMVRNHLLPKLHLVGPLSLQRTALETVVALPDGPCRVVSVHLAHAARNERQLKIARLKAILSTSPHDGGAWSGRDYAESWGLDGPPQPQPRRTVVMGGVHQASLRVHAVPFVGSQKSADFAGRYRREDRLSRSPLICRQSLLT